MLLLLFFFNRTISIVSSQPTAQQLQTSQGERRRRENQVNCERVFQSWHRSSVIGMMMMEKDESTFMLGEKSEHRQQQQHRGWIYFFQRSQIFQQEWKHDEWYVYGSGIILPFDCQKIGRRFFVVIRRHTYSHITIPLIYTWDLEELSQLSRHVAVCAALEFSLLVFLFSNACQKRQNTEWAEL